MYTRCNQKLQEPNYTRTENKCIGKISILYKIKANTQLRYLSHKLMFGFSNEL